MQNKYNRSDRKLIFTAAACAVAGAAAGVILGPATSLLGMTAMGAVGAVAGGVILPVAGIGLFFGGKALKHFAQNDGAKIAVLGLLAGLAIAKALFVTPVQAVGKKIKGLFSKKTDKQPPSAAVCPDAEAGTSSLGGKTAQAEFNASGKTGQDKKSETAQAPCPPESRGPTL